MSIKSNLKLINGSGEKKCPPTSTELMPTEARLVALFRNAGEMVRFGDENDDDSSIENAKILLAFCDEELRKIELKSL